MASAGTAKPKLSREQLEAEIEHFAEKVHSTIEKARAQMTDEERQSADAKAKGVFSPVRARARRSA